MQASAPEEESLIIDDGQSPPLPAAPQAPAPQQQQQPRRRASSRCRLLQNFTNGIMAACCILSIVALFNLMSDRDPAVIHCRFSCVRVYSNCPSEDYKCPPIYQDRCFDEYENKPMDNTIGKISCEHPPTTYARELRNLVVWGWVILLCIMALAALAVLFYKCYRPFRTMMGYN